MYYNKFQFTWQKPYSRQSQKPHSPWRKLTYMNRNWAGKLQITIQWTHLRRFAIDSTSKFRVESSLKFHRFWKTNHVEIMTSIQHRNFDVDSTFKIDETSMSSPRGFSYVVSTSNWCNFCTRCFHSIIS